MSSVRHLNKLLNFSYSDVENGLKQLLNGGGPEQILEFQGHSVFMSNNRKFVDGPCNHPKTVRKLRVKPGVVVFGEARPLVRFFLPG